MYAEEMLTEEQIIGLWEKSQADPIFHVQEVQGVDTLEDFQAALLRAIAKYERVAVKSCHDMGKTWTMSKAVLWFLSTHPRAKIVTTAPTARQVKLLLWSEIRAGHAKAKYPLGGEMGVQEWKIAPDWWAVGFTTQKEASTGEGQQNSGFQGIHAEWVLVIFDEATGIPADVWKQLEGLMTSANVKFVAIGNPTTRACEFYRCFSDSSYKKIHLSCFDSPNLRANGITDKASLEKEYNRLRTMDEEECLERLASYKVVRPQLLTTRWVMSRALKWGLDHALFLSKALGEFPIDDERCLMSLGAVEAAQRRKPKKGKGEVYIGVDPARFGGDLTVVTTMHDWVVKKPKAILKRRTTEISGEVIRIVNALPQRQKDKTVITVDATGIGSGVIDELVEYQQEHHEWRDVEIVEVHFGHTFKEGRDGTEDDVKERNEKYANKKAEMFVLLADDIKTRMCLPERSDVYAEELPTIIYKFDRKGRWVMEDKDQYKKRTGRPSPDHSDSLALCNYGRYHSAGIGNFTAEMARPTGGTIVGPRGDE